MASQQSGGGPDAGGAPAAGSQGQAAQQAGKGGYPQHTLSSALKQAGAGQTSAGTAAQQQLLQQQQAAQAAQQQAGASVGQASSLSQASLKSKMNAAAGGASLASTLARAGSVPLGSGTANAQLLAQRLQAGRAGTAAGAPSASPASGAAAAAALSSASNLSSLQARAAQQSIPARGRTPTQAGIPSSIPSTGSQPPRALSAASLGGASTPTGKMAGPATAQQQISLQEAQRMRTGPPLSAAHLSQERTRSNIINRENLQDLVKKVDARERLDPDVEEALMDVAEDFIDSVTSFACNLAKHRGSGVLEARDVRVHLEQNWKMSIPGFAGPPDLGATKSIRKPSDKHKQRMAAIKKAMSGSGKK